MRYLASGRYLLEKRRPDRSAALAAEFFQLFQALCRIWLGMLHGLPMHSLGDLTVVFCPLLSQLRAMWPSAPQQYLCGQAF